MTSPYDADRAFVQMFFVELGQQLASRYVELHDQAADEQERLLWQDRVLELRERRRTVNSADNEELLRCIERWSEALDNLAELDEK